MSLKYGMAGFVFLQFFCLRVQWKIYHRLFILAHYYCSRISRVYWLLPIFSQVISSEMTFIARFNGKTFLIPLTVECKCTCCDTLLFHYLYIRVETMWTRLRRRRRISHLPPSIRSFCGPTSRPSSMPLGLGAIRSGSDQWRHIRPMWPCKCRSLTVLLKLFNPISGSFDVRHMPQGCRYASFLITGDSLLTSIHVQYLASDMGNKREWLAGWGTYTAKWYVIRRSRTLNIGWDRHRRRCQRPSAKRSYTTYHYW